VTKLARLESEWRLSVTTVRVTAAAHLADGVRYANVARAEPLGSHAVGGFSAPQKLFALQRRVPLSRRSILLRRAVPPCNKLHGLPAAMES
jgi:class 3 adenylate cyclase